MKPSTFLTISFYVKFLVDTSDSESERNDSIEFSEITM